MAEYGSRTGVSIYNSNRRRSAAKVANRILGSRAGPLSRAFGCVYTMQLECSKCCSKRLEASPHTMSRLAVPYFYFLFKAKLKEGAATSPTAARGRGGALNHSPRSVARSSWAANALDGTARNKTHTQQCWAHCQRREASQHKLLEVNHSGGPRRGLSASHLFP